MDNIDRAIETKGYVTKNPNILEKTWLDFSNMIRSKKLILYGITQMINYMWMRCTDSEFTIIAAIDNDSEKQGCTLSEFFGESDLKAAKDVRISSKQILKQFNPDEVVILISSIRYYENIAEELDQLGFHNYFSMLNLEYYYRTNNPSFETQETYRQKYAQECVKNYPVQNDKVMFYAIGGSYSDHEKYITEQLLSMNAKLDIVWIMNRKSINVPKNVRVVYSMNWKQYVYEMETAKMWIFDCRVPIYLIKREEQIYIQTKHWGSITLKDFYPTKSFDEDKRTWAVNGEWMDYVISGSEFDENSCRRGLNFSGKFLRFGSPRSDSMFNSQKCKEKICKHFQLGLDEHILLYAPTYRYHSGKRTVPEFTWLDLNFEMLVKSLKQRWPGIWKIFVRLHTNVRSQSKQIVMPDYVLDASDYDDSQELASAADIMISDFSSIMFEPAYVLKPVFLYAPDKNSYEVQDYDLLLDYDSLPFPISTTNEELSSQIQNFDENKYEQTVKAFLDKYGVNEDGHASERAAKFVLELLSEVEDGSN